ncbi:hypothetical protein Vretifemale_8336, partial [Volvox reticuliferus]
ATAEVIGGRGATAEVVGGRGATADVIWDTKPYNSNTLHNYSSRYSLLLSLPPLTPTPPPPPPSSRLPPRPPRAAPPRSSRNASLLAALAAVQGEGCHLALGEKGPDSASLTYLRAALASSTELVRAGWRVKASERDVELACRAMGSLAQPSSAATERAVLKALAEYVAAALERFPSSLEQDLARLEGREGYEKVTGPERLAVVALASQKRALRGTAQTVATWQAKLAAGCPLEELYRDDEDGEWAEEDEEGEEGEGDEHL